jgi:bacterioferritin
MAKTTKQLISLLNRDLELEYSAAIQYINHAAVMTGAQYGDIIKELKIHANEEIQHAVILADQIDFLGGGPSVKVGKVLTSKNNKEMLQQDLEGEQDAIKRYKKKNRTSRSTERVRLGAAAKKHISHGARTRHGPKAGLGEIKKTRGGFCGKTKRDLQMQYLRQHS